MSANNYVLIKKTKQGFKVSHRDADTNVVFGAEVLVKTADEALEAANELQEEGEAEYGIVYSA